VSVENAAASGRVDDLREVPPQSGSSCEPLLGSLAGLDLGGIGWVIAGVSREPMPVRCSPRGSLSCATPVPPPGCRFSSSSRAVEPRRPVGGCWRIGHGTSSRYGSRRQPGMCPQILTGPRLLNRDCRLLRLLTALSRLGRSGGGLDTGAGGGRRGRRDLGV
jgi:hypothetical protein